VGALLVESDRHVRPEALTAGVRDAIIATGGVVREGVSAQRFRADPGRVRAVLCEGLAEEADAFVLAAGAETGFLTKRLGIRLPIQAGKGYSITVQNPQVSVAQATYFAGVKVGLTPFGNALRIAGTMELSGINRRLDRRRLKNLERAVRRYARDYPPGGIPRGAAARGAGGTRARHAHCGGVLEGFRRDGTHRGA